MLWREGFLGRSVPAVAATGVVSVVIEAEEGVGSMKDCSLTLLIGLRSIALAQARVSSRIWQPAHLYHRFAIVRRAWCGLTWVANTSARR